MRKKLKIMLNISGLANATICALAKRKTTHWQRVLIAAVAAHDYDDSMPGFAPQLNCDAVVHTQFLGAHRKRTLAAVAPANAMANSAASSQFAFPRLRPIRRRLAPSCSSCVKR